MPPDFIVLNNGWNAEPNAPAPVVRMIGQDVELSFFVNAFIFDDVEEEDVGRLLFTRCSRYRLGPTNDEGWSRGQCRYTGIAPAWGAFYELRGEDPLRDVPSDWHRLAEDARGARHFLFYLRDETFECMARDWTYRVERGPHPHPW